MDYHLFRELIAALLLLDWLAFLPFFRVAFFRRGQEASILGKSILAALMALLWPVCCLALIVENEVVCLAGVVVLFLIFRHYYISLRWTDIRRGFGAPGFMAYWVVFYLLLLEISRVLDASGKIPQGVFGLLKFDFALIVLCAGTYKAFSGYLHSHGMEYGQANPMWGYFWRFFKEQNADGFYFRLMNFLACGVEIFSGLMMLSLNPWVQFVGAAMVASSFLYIAMVIRLGRLAFLMVVIPLAFWPPLASSITLPTRSHAPTISSPAIIMVLSGLPLVAMLLISCSKAMQYLNLFGNRRFPSPLQKGLTHFANFWPVIVWRVFTVDVTNFFVRIYSRSVSGEEVAVVHEDTTYRYGAKGGWLMKLRFLHVTESIALVSIFTTLKYFPSKPELFRDKLRSYSRSLLPSLSDDPSAIRFEYVSLNKTASGFDFLPVGSFTVDLRDGTIVDDQYVSGFDYACPAAHSPVREMAGAGTYNPKIQ